MKPYLTVLCLAASLLLPLRPGYALNPADDVGSQPTAAQAARDTQNLAEEQRAAKQAAQAAMEAPLPVERAEEAVEQAPGGGNILARNIIAILLILLLVGIIVLIFRIPQIAVRTATSITPAVAEPGKAPALSKTGLTDLRIVNPRFLELAIAHHLITAPDGADLAKRFRGNDFAILLYLAMERPQVKDSLGKLWGEAIGFAYVNLDTTAVQPEAVRQVSRDFAETNQLVPLYSFGGTLSIAAANPANRELETLVFNRFNIVPSFTFAFPDDIADTIAIAYQSADGLKAVITDLHDEHSQAVARAQGVVTTEQLYQQANSSQVIEFVNGLILLAINEMTSDIHVEPDELKVRIRFRIDGILQEQFVLDIALLPTLVSRLKIMAGCDIAEKRLPQDGRIKFALARRKVDMRFSAVPTLYGEKIVLRLLGSTFSRAIPNIDEMDFSGSVVESIKSVARAPNGVFFVTGPTGSGKTTTLYSILKYINTPGINIMTVEDPVEYRLSGINQVQVNTSINLDFVRVLRSFLRQDPNVILIGEIRDIESARIASQAALTGHLVFATMHTNNALQAVNRMIDIGVEPFLVAPSLIALMAQRLVRRICPHCREKYRVPQSVLDDNFEMDDMAEIYFFKGKGCPKCHGTGYLGRLALHEIFILNSETREKIAQNASILAVEAIALKSGFKPLRYDGLKKVLRGLTTIEEVDRVTYADVD